VGQSAEVWSVSTTLMGFVLWSALLQAGGMGGARQWSLLELAHCTRWNKLEIRSDTPGPMSTSTCNWWTACAHDVFNSQWGVKCRPSKQDLVPTNVNVYRVARKRRKPKNSCNKKAKWL
jgi:hypothetical protein